MNTEVKDDVDKSTVFECNECGEEHSDNDEVVVSGYDSKIYCQSCFDDNFFECSECSDFKPYNESVEYSGDNICDSCFRNDFWRCENCDDVYRQGDDCESCENEDSIPYRDYDTGDTYTIKSERAYSCEVECYYPSVRVMRKVAEEIPEEIGITSDGSLNDRGIEFNTPKLSGVKGEKCLRNFLDTLKENDFTVNSSCGLHVHLDGADIMKTRFAVQKVMLFYMVFEDVIMSFLPMSRRDNRYCLPLSEFYHVNEIKNAGSLENLETIWYREQSKDSIEYRKKDRHDNSRYSGINFHSLLANGHLEVRYHSGTINQDKILNWIKLNVLILDKVVASCQATRENLTISLPTLLKTRFTLGLPEKTKSFFEMLNLSNDQREYFLARQKKFTGNASEE